MHRMATYKRRIVYLSDEEWEAVSAKSQARGFTISEYIRRILNGNDLGHSTWTAVKAQRTGAEHIPLKGRPGEPNRYSTRPFTPVPKHK
jgi:hypothetical protein